MPVTYLRGPKKNTALVVAFPMVDKTDFNTKETGISPSCQVDKDGGGFVNCTNSASEIGSTGLYRVSLTAAEAGADTIIFKADDGGAACAETVLIIYTDLYSNEDVFNGAEAAARIAHRITGWEGDSLATLSAQIDIIEAKLPSKDYLRGTDDADGGMDSEDKADVNAEVDTALNTAIPGSPTADSINERVKAVDDKLPSKSYIRGSADSDGGMDSEDLTDIETGCDNALDNAISSPTTDSVADCALKTRKDKWNKKDLEKTDETHYRETLYDDDGTTPLRQQYLSRVSDVLESREENSI